MKIIKLIICGNQQQGRSEAKQRKGCEQSLTKKAWKEHWRSRKIPLRDG
jgi:hypothetical protein